MKNLKIISVVILVMLFQHCKQATKKNEWISLFNGKDLSGWKANENEGSFKVVDGVIVANGERSHLLYTGDVADANFKNFELNLDIKTHSLANSGVYFHTASQKEGWLEKGYEVQVNSSHKGAGDYKEVKKGGSLYGVRNTYKALVKDSVWYNLNILVQGKHVTVKMNDMLIVDYTEPDSISRIGSGTFALQGHDPLSTVHFKNIKVKILDDDAVTAASSAESSTFPEILKYQKDHFAFIDSNVPVDSAFNVDKAIQSFYQTGINLGLVTSSVSESDLLNFVKEYSRYPVFIGLQNNSGALNKSTDVVNQFDYVIGEITQFKSSKGKMVDVRGSETIANRELFMEDYVKAIVERLNAKTIDVWSNPTLLPAALSADYDKLWTKERMNKVLDAAKQNAVAIAVNNMLKLPGMEFLKLAKEKGCHFALTGIYSESGMAKPDYYLNVIEQCNLTYKDIYIPKNND